MALVGVQSGSILSAALSHIKRTFPVITTVRWWRERPQFTRRFGFTLDHHITGPLPRVKATPNTKKLPGPEYRPKNAWSIGRATFGQNDYIDILGDGNLYPRDLLTEGPHWVRGFKGCEFRRLIRKRNATMHYAPYIWPTKWNLLQKRLKYLYSYHNFKQNHKDWRNLE